MNYRFTVHFSISFSTTRTLVRTAEEETFYFADATTLGFAISLMTSASVALADCFLLFFLPVVLWECFIDK
jgi:hypothetical protein